MINDGTGREGRSAVREKRLSEFPGATPRQRELLTRLERDAAGLTVRWDEARGVVASMRGPLVAAGEPRSAPRATVKRFLAQYGPLFGPERLAWLLQPLRVQVDDRGWTHLEYLQTARARGRGKRQPTLEVYGAHLVAHVRDDRELVEVQSGCWRDVALEARPKITARALGKILVQTAITAPEYREVERRMRRAGRRAFPLMRPPRLVVYPWQAAFRLAWVAYAYQDLKGAGREHGGPGARLQLAQVFVDAVTGERFLVSPLGMHVETSVVGSGLSVTKSGPGAFVNRALQVVRIDQTTVHRLKDLTHAREIITYDLACDSDLPGAQEMADAVTANPPSLAVSENAVGSAWTTVSPPAVRKHSQQPEVDAHFFVGKIYEWYDALAGGRDGWDHTGVYPTTKVPPNLPVRVVTHVFPFNMVEARFDKGFDATGRWIPFLMLWDCDVLQACTIDGDRALDYFAGARTIVGHEYQHGITAFSFIDGDGDPGIGYVDWTAAFHEGLSDAFGCLFSDTWAWGPEISPVGLVIRNAAFPRDPLAWENLPATGTFACGLGRDNRDHFADALAATNPYARGTVLAHCAFLMAAGGLHERASRTPQYIPVQALDHETRGGLDFPRAARIWYDALTQKMQAYVTNTGLPNVDSGIFRALRDGCVQVAEDLFGAPSREHATTALAFYAVGLQPAGIPYGADVTFVPWAASWRLSRPYQGGMYGTAPDWASVDLFVNNGAGSLWNAVVNTIGPTGLPTTIENTVYCRVRNVGDQDALNVHVDLFYAAVGTAPVVWLPVADKNGASPGLTIARLEAGQSSFPDADQQTPPASAGVRWYIPPLPAGTAVDHFCLKAVVSAANDVNPFNNEVQSNVTYVHLVLGRPFKLALWIANPTAQAIPLELAVETSLPPGWAVKRQVSGGMTSMEPDEKRLVEVVIDIPADALERMESPFDGEIVATLSGPLSGECRGALTAAGSVPDALTGRVALVLPDIGTLRGTFRGRLDTLTGKLVGQVAGHFDNAATGGATPLGVALSGHLAPWRRVNVSQAVDGRVVGGVSLEVTEITAEPPDPS